MKLKSVLAKGVAIKYDISVETNGEFKLYCVNYLAKEQGITLNTSAVMMCDCFYYLPKEIMDREVTYIGINMANESLDISCCEKNTKGRRKKV